MRKPTSPRQADQAFRKDLIETIDSGSFSGAGACTAAPMLPPSLPMPASAGLSLSLSLSLSRHAPPSRLQGKGSQRSWLRRLSWGDCLSLALALRVLRCSPPLRANGRGLLDHVTATTLLPHPPLAGSVTVRVSRRPTHPEYRGLSAIICA